MCPFIEVNYLEFGKVASTIDSYTKRQKQQMKEASNLVNNLRSNWIGNDSEEFLSKWNEIDDRSSTTGQLEKALEDYAETLRYVADQYKKAQKKAIDRANSL